MPTILRNKATTIEIDRSSAVIYNVHKGDFDVILEDTGNSASVPMVKIVLRSRTIIGDDITLDWRDISEPTFESAEQLRDRLLEWNVMQGVETSVSKVPATKDNVKLMDFNEKRKMATIYNNATPYLFIKYGRDASSDSFSLRIASGDYLELPPPCYLGRIDGFWGDDDEDGNAMITEIS